MAGRKKHAERSRKTHTVHEATRSSGLNAMALIINRNVGMRNNIRGHQRKGVS